MTIPDNAKIEIRIECHLCHGRGMIPNSQWDSFFEFAERTPGCQDTPPDAKEFFGYIPPEEIACPDCEGEGEITNEITFAELRNEIINPIPF